MVKTLDKKIMIKKKSKEVLKGKKANLQSFRLTGKVFFLTYKGIAKNGDKLCKNSLANFLLKQNKNELKIRSKKYMISEQTYADGQPHFHVILVYQKRKDITNPAHYDINGIHPNIQPMRNMKAALDYMYKEDPNPLTNMDIEQQKRVAKAKDSSSLYQLLQEEMKKDPFNFNVETYCVKYNLDKQIYKANFSKAIKLIKIMQPAYARAILQNKLGIKLITKELIENQLTSDQLKQYYSHSCYQAIVDHINQIYHYPNRGESTRAPLKTRHLLIVGDSDIGKSSLIYHYPNTKHPYPGLSHYYATYYLSIGQKYFPPYRSYDYRLVNWEQFTIISDMFPKSGYNRLLNYLDGSPSALPQKGRAPVERQDNPKHFLTSNRTLEEHICKTFKSEESRAMSRKNLGARIECIIIPKGKSLHFLRKLFVNVN